MSTSTIIQVSQPNDVTIRIDLTIHNGQSPISMQQQILHPHQQLQQPASQPQVSTQSAQIEGLMRSINSLSVSGEPLAPSSGKRANQLLASINAQTPPKLNFENRRKKAAAAAAAAAAASGMDRSQTQVIGIPDVPENEELRRTASFSDDDDDGNFGRSRQNSNQQVVAKAPTKAYVPHTSSNFAKLSRSGVDGSDDDEDIMKELENGDGYGRGAGRRQRQLSSATTNASAPSPYSSNTSHLSDSPPGFSASVPTPPSNEEHPVHHHQQQHQQRQPGQARLAYGMTVYNEPLMRQQHQQHQQQHQQHQHYFNHQPPVAVQSVAPEKRKRGRPRKNVDNAAAAAAAAAAGSSAIATGANAQQLQLLQPHQQPQLQPRQQASAASNFFGLGSQRCNTDTDFISSEELQDARRVISSLPDSDLIKPNDHGDLLCHKLAREGNWPKVVAVNLRLLNNTSFGDIYAGINAPNSAGRTVLLEAVQQRNVKAVAYCCLFTSCSDCFLLRALAEAALLPRSNACDEIFFTILSTVCQDMDVNGNSVMKSSNQYINAEIDWNFSSIGQNYNGLTILQLLALQPSDRYARLAKLIDCGADPLCSISRNAMETYRPYMDCPRLAAKFSPAPLECLEAMGMIPRDIPMLHSTQLAFKWDTDCQVSHSCAKIISSRTDLSAEYRESARLSLSGPELPVLKVEEIEGLAPVDPADFCNMLELFTV